MCVCVCVGGCMYTSTERFYKCSDKNSEGTGGQVRNWYTECPPCISKSFMQTHVKLLPTHSIYHYLSLIHWRNQRTKSLPVFLIQGHTTVAGTAFWVPGTCFQHITSARKQWWVSLLKSMITLWLWGKVLIHFAFYWFYCKTSLPNGLSQGDLLELEAKL